MGKQLKNPPVYYTIAQVRFNPLLKLADFLPSIQERFRRERFPGFTHLQTIAVQMNVGSDGQPVPQTVQFDQYVFGSTNNHHAFLLTKDFLSFQSTDYQGFEEFSKALFLGLRLLHDEVNLDFTERLGLRYLNFVVAPEEGLQAVLEPGALGMSALIGGNTRHSFTETLTAFEDIQLVSRVVVQDGTLGWPSDLQPLGQSMALKAKFMTKPCRHAIVDTDGFVEERAEFNLDALSSRLTQIHDVVEKAFEDTTTKHARRVWDER